MNRRKTKRLVERNNVVTLKADKTRESLEIDELLVELGNTAKAIPYYAIFPGNGREPIVLDNLITQAQILRALEEAGPSSAGTSGVKTAMNQDF